MAKMWQTIAVNQSFFSFEDYGTCYVGKSSLLVLLDFSAAFDTIDQMLLEDMSAFCVWYSALFLVWSYLSDRFQGVVVGGERSEPVTDLEFHRISFGLLVVC